MLRRVFFLLFFILIFNPFDVAFSNELNVYDLSLSKRELITSELPISQNSVLLRDAGSENAVESSQIELKELKELKESSQFLLDKRDENFDIDKMQLAVTGTTTTLGVFSPLLTKDEKGGIWVRPYSSFENIPLSNGPTVNSVMYGSLLGIDSSLKYLKHNWQAVYTGYAGYTGSEQTFGNKKQIQNSGLGGLNITLYRNDFFTSWGINAGGSNLNSNDSQDAITISAGLVTRTGYNFKLPHHLVIQPNYIMSYTYARTLDYFNNAGAKITNDPIHTIQITPSMRVYANLKGGLQPYLIVNMNFNLIGLEKVTADFVSLPTVAISPFVEYGGGIQKNWDKAYSGFFQTLVRQGGRNGVAFLAGFRWAVGKH